MKDLKIIVNDVKNKGHVDNIHGKVIKDAMKEENFAIFLLDFVNESIEKSEMPKNLKTSVINPIPKTSNPTMAEDFRPINMLPVIEKIIEIVVKNQLLAFIEENNLLIAQQSGFRKKHSCETAINLMLSDWIMANMIEKLRLYGADENAIKWFHSYLSDRKQQVKIDQTYSECRDVNVGLPQGSVLSPVMFVLYINDINKVLKHSRVNLFADDTAISISEKNSINCLRKNE